MFQLFDSYCLHFLHIDRYVGHEPSQQYEGMEDAIK